MALYATNRFAGDGVTTSYEFNFVGEYLARSHVKAYQEDNATRAQTPVAITDSNFLNDTTLHMLPATPVGKTLVIYRDTPKAPLVNFVNGSRFTEYNLDTATRQGSFIAVESADALSPEGLAGFINQLEGFSSDAETARDQATASAAVATTRASEALASAVSSELAKDNAVAAAGAIGPIKFYGTHAQALGAIGGLASGDLIEVSQDETRAGARTRYEVQAGALVFVVNLDQVRIDLSPRLQRAILSYPDYAAAAAETTLPDGQEVSVDADENRNRRPTQYVVDGGALVFAGYARSMNSGVYIPTPLDFGADPYGIKDSSQAMSDFWAYIKTQLVNLYPTTLPFCKEKFTIPSGVYRIANSVNWTGLRAWNVQIIADGVIFVGDVDNLPIVENLDCRGVHMQGLAILSRADRLPQSGLLIGPKGTVTCGNNKFTDVKVLGHFSIAPLHNLGSETTRHDMCYYMNRVGFAAAYDGLNSLGAVSSYVALRSPGVAVSFTNNTHVSCRFENSDTSANAKDAVFLEGVVGWESDKACYFLAFAGAGIQLRDLNGVYRTSNLKIAGLFETSFAPGLKYCMRIVVADGVSTATANFVADFQRSHAKTAIIRVETPSGAALTAGAFNFRTSEIRHDDVAYGASKLFDGSRISYIGRINLREGSIINVKDLLFGYGEIFTDDVSTIPAPTANSQVAFDVYGAGSLSGAGMQKLLGNGSGVGFQGGVHPAVRAVGPNADHDLALQGKGAGYVRFGALTPNADTPVTGYITIKDASGTLRKLAVIV